MSTHESQVSVFVAALFVQGLLYGVFALFFCIVLSIALGPKHGRFLNRARILQISGLMFLLATAHLIITLFHIFVALSSSRGFDDLTTFLLDLRNPMVVGKTSICLVQVMLGDSILVRLLSLFIVIPGYNMFRYVWRCYVLHNRMIWVLIPGIIVLALEMATIILYRVSITQGIGPQWQGGVAFLVVSVVLHMSYTGIIVRKIYRSTNLHNIRATSRSHTPIMAALIESGAIYSVTAIAFAACTATNSPGTPIVMDIIPPLVGDIFCLLILQIHVYYVKDRELPLGGVSANWSIPWRREPREDEVPDTAP